MNNRPTFPPCVWVSLSLFTVNRRVIFHPSKWNQGYVSIETSPGEHLLQGAQRRGPRRDGAPWLTHDQVHDDGAALQAGSGWEGQRLFLGGLDGALL